MHGPINVSSYLSVLLKDAINCTHCTDKTVNLELWWNETTREEVKSWEKNLSQCQFVHHKSDIEWTGVQPAENPQLSCWVRKGRLYFWHYIWRFSKKVAVNAESYLIVFSQSAYPSGRQINPSSLAIQINHVHSWQCHSSSAGSAPKGNKTLGRYNWDGWNNLQKWNTNHWYIECTGVLISSWPDQEGNKLGSMAETRVISTNSRRELS